MERAEGLEVIERDLVSEQVEENVLEGARVAVGQDKAVAVEPLGIGGICVHKLAEEHVGHRGTAHGGARMAFECLKTL